MGLEAPSSWRAFAVSHGTAHLYDHVYSQPDEHAHPHRDQDALGRAYAHHPNAHSLAHGDFCPYAHVHADAFPDAAGDAGADSFSAHRRNADGDAGATREPNEAGDRSTAASSHLHTAALNGLPISGNAG